jgi:hypothetical protein
MNKNKIIFAIIWILLIIGIVYVIMNLNTTPKPTWIKKTWVFSIWMIWDNVDKTARIIEDFKKIHPEFANQEIKVESFWSSDDYTYALTSAIISGKAPDIFVLNNNEKKSVFSNQVIWIDPLTISPNDFRKKYKWFFADDLIVSIWEWEKKQEYLQWIPVWYETLWIFYNRRYVKDSDLKSLATLNNVISNLKKDKPELVPIWIWNGSTVYDASDIISQFFMLEKDVSSLEDVVSNKMKQWLSSYLLYWDIDWVNAYNSRYDELASVWKNNIDLFSVWDTYMIVWYPRMINQIKEKWFSKNFLLASVFPHYNTWEWKTLVNYNYFVINKDTTNSWLANAFLWYLSSDKWADEYLKQYTYYLPALLSLEADKLEKPIHDDYNVVLGDFLSSDYELSSFDKWIKNIYDKSIISILDNSSNYENLFEKLRKSISCKSNKFSTLTELSTSCD